MQEAARAVHCCDEAADVGIFCGVSFVREGKRHAACEAAEECGTPRRGFVEDRCHACTCKYTHARRRGCIDIFIRSAGGDAGNTTK